MVHVLREAEIYGGKKLGPTGSRIVASVILGALRSDRDSILNQKAWLPFLPSRHAEDFRMSDLVRFTNNWAT